MMDVKSVINAPFSTTIGAKSVNVVLFNTMIDAFFVDGDARNVDGDAKSVFIDPFFVSICAVCVTVLGSGTAQRERKEVGRDLCASVLWWRPYFQISSLQPTRMRKPPNRRLRLSEEMPVVRCAPR
jgi:hypothetical protein